MIGAEAIFVDKLSVADRPFIGAAESSWYLLPPVGAAALVVLGHAVLDVHDGTWWTHTLLPSIVIILQPIVLTIGHRWLRTRQTSRPVRIATFAVASALLGILTFQLHTDPPMGFARTLIHGIPLGLLSWGFWELVYRVPLLIREANLRTLNAESIRREAELMQLRASLQPHFLLNTLHTIAALTVDEPLVARRLLSALGDLLRDALATAPEIRPLETDLQWLRRYTEILEIRHRGSLRFEWDVAPETNAVPLPKLLLQPLIENAVKHGALRRGGGGGAVSLRARFAGEKLQIVVEDNGPGLPPGSKDGLGLRIVRERVALAHPHATLHFTASSEGTRATIEIPRSTAERP